MKEKTCLLACDGRENALLLLTFALARCGFASNAIIIIEYNNNSNTRRSETLQPKAHRRCCCVVLLALPLFAFRMPCLPILLLTLVVVVVVVVAGARRDGREKHAKTNKPTNRASSPTPCMPLAILLTLYSRPLLPPTTTTSPQEHHVVCCALDGHRGSAAGPGPATSCCFAPARTTHDGRRPLSCSSPVPTQASLLVQRRPRPA